MPKQDLNQDDNYRLAKVDGITLTESQVLDTELQATKECWEQELSNWLSNSEWSTYK